MSFAAEYRNTFVILNRNFISLQVDYSSHIAFEVLQKATGSVSCWSLGGLLGISSIFLFLYPGGIGCDWLGLKTVHWSLSGLS